MKVITTVDAVRAVVADARAAGKRIGFVPTMGYLHEGHLQLCDVARGHTDCLVMSVFVNPLQFGPGEDLERYPRDNARDTSLAEGRGVDVMFLPEPGEMYPTGGAVVRVVATALSDRLCGRFRPGHFEGVLTVVAKLFNIVAPHVAVFGQKDLQQSVLIRRMVQDLNMPVEVVTAPIVREHDGLALSSRNVYLKDEERRAATSLSRALLAAQSSFSSGEQSVTALIKRVRAVLAENPLIREQYIELVDTVTLDTPASAARGHAVAVAAFVGTTRLIDNHILE